MTELLASSARPDAIDKKWDQCMARLVVQSGIGAAVGVSLSVILLRRRFWPIPLSVGFAAGIIIIHTEKAMEPIAAFIKNIILIYF